MKLIVAFITAVIISAAMPVKMSIPLRTPDEQTNSPLFSFGIISDVQYCDCPPAGTRYYKSSLQKLDEAFRYFQTEDLKFVLDLGDLIDNDFISYKPVYRFIDSSVLKVYHVTGNHDYSVDQKYKKRIPQLNNSKTGYFSVSVGKYRFIFLNGNEISTYASGSKSNIEEAEGMIEKLKNEGEINAIDWNGGMSKKQIEWLDNTLNEAAADSERVFIACHFPVWPKNEHNLLNYNDVLPLLEKHSNIIAWFNGHNHAGNYGNFNKIHFVTLKGMVETETTNSFAIVDVYNNKIWIRGNGREKSLILAY